MPDTPKKPLTRIDEKGREILIVPLRKSARVAFGQWLKARLAERRMVSLRLLAARSGIDAGGLIHALNGNRRIPDRLAQLVFDENYLNLSPTAIEEGRKLFKDCCGERSKRQPVDSYWGYRIRELIAKAATETTEEGRRVKAKEAWSLVRELLEKLPEKV